MSVVRTRFAPSPTGSLHVGGVRTALYCYLFARHHQGRFVLRIEDTDQVRSSEEASRGILRDLAWLGLTWDEGPQRADAPAGPYYQSQRLALYNGYIEELLASGRAYEAWDTREELEAMRTAARQAKQNFRYRRPALPADEIAALRARGRVPVVRLEHPSHPVTVDDAILGPVTLAEEDLDDIVIRKDDGFPTYHFAVVVDDTLMGITQVLRGKEHLLNTHKHLGIYEALGWTELPGFGHLPLIFNPEGSKMGKRDKARAAREGARAERDRRRSAGHDVATWAWLAEASGVELDEVSSFMGKKHDGLATAQAIAATLGLDLPMIEVRDYQLGGYLPEALLNYLALLGWSPGDDRELMSLDDMAACFTLDRVGKTEARFDPTKLLWMNGEYLRSLPEARVIAALDQYLEVVPGSPLAGLDAARRAELLRLYRERVKTFRELDASVGTLLQAPAAFDAKASRKWLDKGGGWDHLVTARATLAAAPWSADGLLAAIEQAASEADVNLGKLAQPVRIAVTGAAVTPPLGETLAVLDRDDVLARIDALLARRPA